MEKKTTQKKDLDYIYEQQKEVTLLNGASALLGWDQQTYMPEQGVAGKSEQLELLKHLSHERMTSNKLYSALNRLRREIKTGKGGYLIHQPGHHRV